MQVHIVSRQLIKPSSPTLPHLKTYPLSLLDQLSSRFYIARVLFYAPNQSNSSSRDTLNTKNIAKSLSETLAKYYPFAGRLNDGTFIECNDKGVELIEAQISSRLQKVLENPDPHNLHQFFPNEWVVGE